MTSGLAQTMRVANASVNRHLGPALLWFAVIVVGAAAAVSVDVVRAGYGVKSDEATYVATALSAAYDYDLRFERRDLERFVGLYRAGPEGIFLKRGKTIDLRGRGRFPFVEILKKPERRSDRLYFGKALIYPLFAAPFVRAFGLNGMLLFNVLLLGIVGIAAYTFLAARSSPLAAALFTTAFLGACVLPVYAVFLTPEIFNFALVFLAYFLWLYKEVAPSARFKGAASDLAAACLLGCAVYSKPIPNAVLIAPLVALALWRRRWRSAIVVSAVCLAVTVAWFGFNAFVSGEFNYQGGDRRTFYTSFPFDAPDATWDTRGLAVITSGSKAQEMLTSGELPARFARNVEYFLIGRHFGFVPYFFPGVVAVALWLLSAERGLAWRVPTFFAFAGSTVALLLVLPYTWSGGGGPPGNRYLLSAYPTLFFLLPPMTSLSPGVVAWIGGALFTAKILVNPFYSANYPYTIADRGFARRLPVELTMANDLPIMLDAPRTHIWYADVLLYFLDTHAYIPEVIDAAGTKGIWVAGDGRADIIVRSEWAIDHLMVTARSPVPTTFFISIGEGESRVALAPGKAITFDVRAAGVRALDSYSYLLSARSTDAFIPHLQDPSSPDLRNLGVLMTFTATPAEQTR